MFAAQFSILISLPVYMDIVNDCRMYKHDDGMQKGELYLVRSDNSGGTNHEKRLPAECEANFNFGDRLIVINVSTWSCNHPYRGPFFALYADCIQDEEHLLVSLL